MRVNDHPTTRRKWREVVERELAAMGAVVVPIAAAYRIAKGSAYVLVTDLADVNEHELRMLAKA